jgi:hypothetical protein
MLVLVGFMVVTMALGGPQSRAAAVPSQILSTTAPKTTPTTTPRVSTTLTTVRTTVTTRPAPTTSRSPATTAVRTYSPVAPPANRQYVAPTSAAPSTTTSTSTTTTTTIAPISGQVPVAPLTLPLRTKGSNGHVNPVFAWLSGVGFLIALLIVAARLVITRPGGRDRAPLPARPDATSA